MPVPETLEWNVLTAAYASTGQTFVGSAGIDLMIGGSGDDLMRGYAGNDRFDAGDGDDLIDGGAGVDHIDGGGGDDTMIGGAGDDTYIVGSAGDLVVERTGGGFDTVHASLTHTLSPEVEQLVLTGFAAINGTGNTGNNILVGNGAANVLSGLNGNDELRGGFGNDTLLGGAGNVVLRGEDGNDVMNGGAGDDTYYVQATGDVIVEAADGGDDTVWVTGFSSHTLGTNLERLATLDAAAFTGIGNGEGGDTLTGGAGSDTLSYFGSFGGVVVDLETGIAYSGDAEGDTISGFENAEGSEMGDLLIGDAGVNRLSGRAGFDVLNGGRGNDVLSGGGDSDFFAFGLGFGRDTVTDFVAGDFGEAVGISLGAAFDTFSEVMAVASASGAGGQNTLLTFDANNSLLLLNVNVASLTDDNFFFV